MGIERSGFGEYVPEAVRRWFFSEQDIRRSIRAGILGLYTRLDRATAMKADEKQALRRTVKNLKAEIIALNRRYHHASDRPPTQVQFNRDRIRRMIDDIRFLEEAIDAAPSGEKDILGT